MRSSRQDEPGDLGDGLTEVELYFWADRKYEQNRPHFLRGHLFCDKCKNCLCGKKLSGDVGFRCMCAFGKTLVTPYRIRFYATSERLHLVNREIYCMQHHVYEPKGFVCG